MSKPRFEFTPEHCTKHVLNMPWEVFVYPSNVQGIPGAGAAKTAATDFGALRWVPMGPQGHSYAIVTKDLNQKDLKDPEYQARMLYFIKKQVAAFWCFATFRPDTHFYVTPLGLGLAGFTVDQMREVVKVLREKPLPNIILPKEFA